MLGRLIDQLLPEHVNNPQDKEVATSFISKHPSILGQGNYTPSSPWGTTLSLFQASDLNIINLETAVTTTPERWPNKKYNYRMHPANLAPILHAAQIDYANLANNHVLDFGSEGLVETAWTLKSARIAFSGAGETTNEAFKPVELALPRKTLLKHGCARIGTSSDTTGTITTIAPESTRTQAGDSGARYLPVHIYSASDHPQDWGSVPNFHLIDYSPSTRDRLRRLLLSNGVAEYPGETDSKSDTHHDQPKPGDHDNESTQSRRNNAHVPALKILSIHWGPNYIWKPEDRIRSLAHFLVDECGVDIVHGHSSHHVQGVEVYRGKIIIYGCGDFVDDYVLHPEFRNDLGAVWRVVCREKVVGGPREREREGKGLLGLSPVRLEIFPTRIDKFRAMLLDSGDVDHNWVWGRVGALSRDLDTRVRGELGEEGQIIVDIE
jgi:poly-gamma-glutamate capsule biosynthesis protein CapA/YwtB (metallophosphatase superfamily)